MRWIKIAGALSVLIYLGVMLSWEVTPEEVSIANAAPLLVFVVLGWMYLIWGEQEGLVVSGILAATGLWVIGIGVRYDSLLPDELTVMNVALVLMLGPATVAVRLLLYGRQ